jgi:hypothetical protein
MAQALLAVLVLLVLSAGIVYGGYLLAITVLKAIETEKIKEKAKEPLTREEIELAKFLAEQASKDISSDSPEDIKQYLREHFDDLREQYFYHITPRVEVRHVKGIIEMAADQYQYLGKQIITI